MTRIPSSELLVLLKRRARIRSICGPFSCACPRARTCTTICPAPSTPNPGFAPLGRTACASTSQPFPSAPPTQPAAAAAPGASTTAASTASTAAPTTCGEGRVPAAQAYADQHLYDALIDAFSMRSFVPTSAVSGHDHFFDTFAKFGGTSRAHTPEWLDEVATRAASQSEQYLELMNTPSFAHAQAIAAQIGWRDDFAQMRNELLARGLRDDVAEARAEFDQPEALRRHREHCGEAGEAPACHVEIRYLYQVLRALPRETVFAQTLLGFEVASADPLVVGLNFVQPEDGATSMADYALHMKMLGFLHGLYPQVHIALHAGELAPGLVPPEGLCCHIRLAVEEAHAERIGHGVDVMYEERPYELLKEMAARHVLVEVNLTSNDVILGVSGSAHPLPIYLRFRVPVALATDDEGVSRIDLTHEFCARRGNLRPALRGPEADGARERRSQLFARRRLVAQP